jgi:hypothetical protein
MASSGMSRPMALVRIDVSEELSAPIIRVTRIVELGTALAVTRNRRTLRHFGLLRNVCRLLVTANVVPSSPILVTPLMEAIRSSETSVLTTVKRRNIPEYAILHCTINLSSLYMFISSVTSPVLPLYIVT